MCAVRRPASRVKRDTAVSCGCGNRQGSRFETTQDAKKEFDPKIFNNIDIRDWRTEFLRSDLIHHTLTRDP
jgi:hypothetical protein